MCFAEPLMCELKKGPPMVLPKSSYIGGEIRYREDSEVPLKLLLICFKEN